METGCQKILIICCQPVIIAAIMDFCNLDMITLSYHVLNLECKYNNLDIKIEGTVSGLTVHNTT